MKILYMGGGFVGACSAAVTADSGHDVLVFDVDENKVKKLSTDDRDVIQSCLHEDGLSDLLIRNRKRIKFTSNKEELSKFVHDAEAVFMCLPTPEKKEGDGESDLSYYQSAVEMIGPALSKRNGANPPRIVIVNKSTVPIKMIDFTEELFVKQGVKNFGIVSNPEFLVEGKAIKGSVNPDRVVVGAKTKEDFEVMRKIYQRFYDSSTVKYIEVNPYEAAAGKLLANYLLFNKIVTTYDVVGRTCEYFPHIKFEEVRKILMSDQRIGNWGLYDSVYAGGSCFIKDAGSLSHQLEQAGGRATLVRNILDANNFQLEHFFGRAETEAGFNWSNKTVAVLGAAFKQDTNDIRNSGAIGIIHELLGSGVEAIKVYDPVAIEECKKYFDVKKNTLYKKIAYAENVQSCIEKTNATIICTDWPEFKTLSEIFKNCVHAPYLIMDGRRIIHADYDQLSENGFDLIAVGSPFIKGKK